MQVIIFVQLFSVPVKVFLMSASVSFQIINRYIYRFETESREKVNLATELRQALSGGLLSSLEKQECPYSGSFRTFTTLLRYDCNYKREGGTYKRFFVTQDLLDLVQQVQVDSCN